MAADYPDQVAGVVYGLDTVIRRLRQVGCEVRTGLAAGAADGAPWRRRDGGEAPAPPEARPARAGGPRAAIPVLRGHPAVLAARPDRPGDLAEEVIRLEGYENIPVRDAARARRAAG